MNIPKHFYRKTVHQNRLVSAEFPGQSLDLHHPLLVDAYLKAGILEPYGVALYGNVVELPVVTELSLRGVELLAVDVLRLGDEHRARWRRPCVGPLIGFFDQVAEEEDHLVVEDQSDVETFEGLRAWSELGGREVPENVYLAALHVQCPRALPLGEKPWLDFHPARRALVAEVIDSDAQALAHQVLAPCNVDHPTAA